MWRIRQGPQFKHGLETLVYLRDLGPVTVPALPWNSRGAYYYSWRDLGLGSSRRYLNWKLSFSLFSNFPSLHAYLFSLCLTLESVTLKQGVIFCLFSIFSTDDVFDCLQLNRTYFFLPLGGRGGEVAVHGISIDSTPWAATLFAHTEAPV